MTVSKSVQSWKVSVGSQLAEVIKNCLILQISSWTILHNLIGTYNHIYFKAH